MEDGKITHISRNLFVTLAANGRISEAPQVITAFGELMQASKGIVQVTIYAAEQLDKKTLDSLEVSVQSIAGKDKKVSHIQS